MDKYKMERMKDIIYRRQENEHKILKIIAFIVVALLIVRIISYVRSRPSHENPFLHGMEVEDFDAYMETQKNVSSDISGMTVYDKYAMGLQRQDGSDSDNDGLTDKEEIETYGTDPLKASTAGDLYTDEYKIASGMDPFKFYDYSENQEFSYNECPEILLAASDAGDFKAEVYDVTDIDFLSDYNMGKPIKAYEIKNYGNTVSIDISGITDKQEITANETEIYWAYGPFLVHGESKINKANTSINEEIINLNMSFDRENDYLLFVMKKSDSLVGSIYKKIFGRYEAKEENTGDREYGKGIITAFPLLGKAGYRVEYVECSTQLHTNALLKRMEDDFKDDRDDYSPLVPTSDNTKAVSDTAYKAKLKFLDTIMPFFRLENTTERLKSTNLIKAIFFYYPYEAYVSDRDLLEDTEDESTDPVNTGFDKFVDELPFQNFESYIAEGGNCAGISHFSSYLYNTKTSPVSGSYECTIDGQKQTIEWDLSEDPENQTLQDAGLIDYKTSEFINEHSVKDNYIGGNLTSGEEEFVNMIGCFWTEGNDRINMNDYELASGEYDDVDLLKKMMQQLDEGKILDVYLLMRYGGAHAVNIYGYEYIDDRHVNFAVYDSNIPQDIRKGFKVNNPSDNQCMFQTTISVDDNGNGTFEYIYWPMKNNLEYMATSHKGFMQTHSIVCMDENWNVLN